jgi:hypothetical protein
MSSTISIAVWIKTQGSCTLLQLASNCLIANARGQTETCASYRYQQFSVAWRMGQAGSGSNFSAAATEKLPVRA